MLGFATYAEAILVKKKIADNLLGNYGIVSVSMKKSNEMFCVQVGVENMDHLTQWEDIFKTHNIPLVHSDAESPFIVIGKIEAQ